MTQPILALEGLCMNFGGMQALSEVSFAAQAGRITAVIGPNGAGKTTAINCISGIYRPPRGEAYFEGQSMLGLASHQLARRGVTRTFQNLQVFTHMSVLENVMVGLHGVTKREFLWALFRLPGFQAEERQVMEQAREMLEFLDLAEMAALPAGQLAYGDQKRVELARALVSRPRLMLLDEPAAGLNAAETESMARTLRAIRDQGISLLLIEHDMSLVMGISDWVVVLDHGCKIAEGTPAQVQAHPEVICAYLGGAAEAGADA